MSYDILVINPGSTSTDVAIYRDRKELFCRKLHHRCEELDRFPTAVSQLDFRLQAVREFLDEEYPDTSGLSCVIGRGGAGLKPVDAGGYTINDLMVTRLTEHPLMDHASNLGALLARTIADNLGLPAYIYDPVTIDELDEVARLSGIPQIKRVSTFHALNSRAAARDTAQEMQLELTRANFIVAHLGGGISLCALKGGRAVDVCSDDEGPFSPERAGALPSFRLADLCFSAEYTADEVRHLIRGRGGVRAYLGTSDMNEVEHRVLSGDSRARAVIDALAYQTAKAIGSLAAALSGEVDAVILTGNLTRFTRLTDRIRERVSFIAPVKVIPGDRETDSLAAGAYRIITGVEEPREYRD